ncbi:MAG: type IV pilus twitching motility protein PilT [Hyalangium sp.]|uniref:type IV pilus twitching motility protein PilT n=1 Tax=Hyalangium sp. TaxID=2028555 RepID=UPI00389A321F
MARLDPIIEKLFKDSGQELLIETGGGVNMRTPTGLQLVLKQNLTTPQILGAISELVPAEQRATFPPEGTTAFPYAAPAGQVQVTLENIQGRVKVSMVPFTAISLPPAPEEEKFELASPYEMLELAAQVVDPAPAAQEAALELDTGPAPHWLDESPASVAPAPVAPAAPAAPAIRTPPARPATIPPVPTAAAHAAVPAAARAGGPATLPPVPAAVPAPTVVPAAPAGPATLPPVPAAAPAVASPVVAAPLTAAHPAPHVPAAPVGPATMPPVPAPAPAAVPVAAAIPVAPSAPATIPPGPATAAPAIPTGPVTQPPVPAAAAVAPAAALTPAPIPVSAPVLALVPEASSPAASSPAVEEIDDHWKEAQAQMLALMEAMLARGASDLHLSSETLPHMRIDGDMVPIEEYGLITPGRLKAMLFSIAPEKNRRQWEELQDTDFAYDTSAARFRVNVFEDRNGIGAVLRQIPKKIRTAEEIGLSRHVLDLCFLTKGLVLVTGPTGSGKSTTLAALIDYVNRHREDHIITIEDPIEFVHKNKSCLVNQREVGMHTRSFKNALRAALREDPDVVLVGEMRDLETIATAIETAETGHLVFGTLHTNTAASTVDRIIDQFPADRQPQIRMMLSESLKGVIAQSLCKRIGGGRVAAQEVLLCTGSVSNLIREGKTFQIPSVMQTSRGQGMVTLNDSLLELVKKKVIEPNEALSKSVARAEMRAMLERAGFKADTPAAAAASGPAETPAPVK